MFVSMGGDIVKKRVILGAAVVVLFSMSFLEKPVGAATTGYKEKWDPIPKMEYKGHNYDLKRFYYDKGDVGPEEYLVNEFMYLDKPTDLYNEKGAKYPNGIKISPQRVQVQDCMYSNTGYWIKINTWIGHKWVKWDLESEYTLIPNAKVYRQLDMSKPAIFENFRPTITVPFYNSPSYNAVMEGKLSPQYLTVSALAIGDNIYYANDKNENAQNAYVGVQTWAGEKWIRAKDLDYEYLNQDIIPVEYTNTFKLYDSPSRVYGKSYTAPRNSINTQVVHAKERRGEFVLIDTWLGEKWIESKTLIKNVSKQDKYYPGHPYLVPNYSGGYYLSEDLVNYPLGVGVWKTPVDAQSKNGGTLVKADGSVWYGIANSRWMKADFVEPYIETTGKLKTFKTLKMFDAPNESSRKLYDLNPQTLTVRAKFGGWYAVDTWIGLKWVKAGADDFYTAQEENHEIKQDTYIYSRPIQSMENRIQLLNKKTVKKIGSVQWHNKTWVQVKYNDSGAVGWYVQGSSTRI